MAIDIKTLLFKHDINQHVFAKFCDVSLRRLSVYFEPERYNGGEGLPEKNRKGANIKKLAEEFAKIKNLS